MGRWINSWRSAVKEEKGAHCIAFFSKGRGPRPKLLALSLTCHLGTQVSSLFSFAFYDGTAGGRSEFAVRNWLFSPGTSRKSHCISLKVGPLVAALAIPSQPSRPLSKGIRL